MDVISLRQKKREAQVNAIIESIRKAIYEDEEITYEKIIMATACNLNLAMRTAREYVDIALFKSGIKLPEIKKFNVEKQKDVIA